MAYVYSEQDNFDLTYFIDFNVRKLKVALDEFEKYLKKEQAESSLVSKVLVGKYNLNERQIRLVRYLQSNKNEQVTIKNHMVVNNITRITAVKDLEGLTKLGFVIKNRSGKKNVYYAGNEIEKLL
jgi:Fic family protein